MIIFQLKRNKKPREGARKMCAMAWKKREGARGATRESKSLIREDTKSAGFLRIF